MSGTSSIPVGGFNLGSRGGGGVVIHNHFGRASVRSDADIEEITRQQERLRQQRGIKIWHV